jgi:hypothetical protein
VRDLPDPTGRQEGDRDRSSRDGQACRFDQAEEPPILAADPSDDRASDRPGLSAALGRLEHPNGALEIGLACV